MNEQRKADEDGLLVDDGVYIDMAIKAKEEHLAVLLKAQQALTAAAKDGEWEKRLKKLRDVLDVARAAIHDAIGCEDGLDGATGRVVMDWITDELGDDEPTTHEGATNAVRAKVEAECQAKLEQVFAEIEACRQNCGGFGALTFRLCYEALKEKWLKEER